MIPKITILGVNISQITKKETIKTVDGWLSRDSGQARMTRFIVTPNPEMLVLAQKDKEFRDVLNRADLAISDGIGLVLASKLLNLTNKTNRSNLTNNYLKERVSGTDLMLDLCQLASQKGYTVGLLGAGEGVAQKTAQVLKEKFPSLKIKFAVSEPPELSLRERSETTDEAISKSNGKRLPRSSVYGVLARNDKTKVDLFFVAFGAPKQEKFLWNEIKYQNSSVNPRHYQRKSALNRGNTRTITQINADNIVINFRVGMGVGGAFDLVSGKIKRAPKLMQNLGLEWLWRLFQEPWKIKRIWTATVVFPWLVLTSPKSPK